jgi:flagellar L-ring protein precursor FlgH
MRPLILAALALAPAALAAQAPATATPTTATPTAAQTTPAQPASARPALRSWLSDRRDFAVGDIITVLVDDYTITSAVKDDIASQRRQRDLSLGVDVNTGGPKATAIDARINSRNNNDAANRGEARRENRFQSEMSVRVVALGPNGTLQVKGTRNVDVDKGQQNVVLSGWLRAQDVSTSNVVESSRVADAQITYLSPGPLGKPKQSLVSRVVSIVWP